MSLLLVLLGPARSVAQGPDSTMTGGWIGRAQVSLPFPAQGALEVRLVVSADGSVSGTIGDATLVGARLAAGRGRMGRALRMGREYMIEGALTGSLIRSVVLQHARVVISLDWTNGTFVGELQTSGEPDGAPESRAVHATGLVLHRAGDIRARS